MGNVSNGYFEVAQVVDAADGVVVIVVRDNPALKPPHGIEVDLWQRCRVSQLDCPRIVPIPAYSCLH